MSITKLYTEEQLLSTIKSVRHYDDVYDEKVANERIEKHLKALHPVEFPSDEEIEERAERNVNKYSFIDGVEWLKDKIQGGNQ